MPKRIMPSPAMVVALLALFVALGGGAYAATNLPRNSVGTRQLRNQAVTIHKLAFNSVGTRRIQNNAVISSKVRNHSLLARDFAPGQLPAGPRGPAGPAGPAGSAGPAGANGTNGANPGVPVVNVPPVTPDEIGPGGQANTGQPGDQGFYFIGRDADGSARLEGGQLVLHGAGLSDNPRPAIGGIGIAKAFSNVPLGDLDALSYIWHINTPFGAHAPTIHMTMSGMNNNSPTGFANLVYTPSQNGLDAARLAASRGAVFQSDGFAAGARWFATGATGEGSASQPQPLSFFVIHNPNAVITQIALNNGGSSGAPANAAFEAGADNLILGFTGSPFTRYDFDS